VSYTPTSNERTWEKFDADGNARLHRGSTIVSRLNADCDVYRAGQRIQEDLKQTELRDHFALTPPNSFHMTVLEGLKDRSLLGQKEKWPEWLTAADFPAAVFQLRQRLVDADLPPAPELRMRVSGVKPVSKSLTITLEPEDAEMKKQLEDFRSAVGEAWEIDVASLEEYFFHISLGYRLSAAEEHADLGEELTERYRGWVSGSPRLERPAFTVFDDMLAFPPILYL